MYLTYQMDLSLCKAFHIIWFETKTFTAKNLDGKYWVNKFPDQKIETIIKLSDFQFIRDAPGSTNRLIFTLGENKFSLVTINGVLCDVPGEAMILTDFSNLTCKLNYSDGELVNYETYPWIATVLL